MNAADPRNDRELLLALSHQVERLSEAIERFAETLQDFEEKKIMEMDKRIKELEKWQHEWGGVYKFILIALSVLTIFSIIIRYT